MRSSTINRVTSPAITGGAGRVRIRRLAKTPLVALAAVLAATAVATPASGGNVDLSTVPTRDTVQLTIYNSEDLTLVRETRHVSFRKGANPLQFSWANTLIDPSSVQLRFVTSQDQLDVLDTTYPHDRPQTLFWNVQSELDGQATIEITYFTSGVTWNADYTLIADAAEKEMGFEGFVRVFNNSGEEYENAQVRLVVGTINLVEKIAQLAQVPMSQVQDMAKDKRDALYREATIEVLGKMDAADAKGAWAEKPKEIIKEGLSEYFIYTIEGTETIPNGWSKRLRSLEAQTVPFDIQYRFRPEEYGEQLVRFYLLTNDTDSKLGTTPLPDGMVRLFRRNGADGLSFLSAIPIKYVPIGDKIELNLGVDPEVVFDLVRLRTVRDNLWNQIGGTNTLRRVDRPGVQINESSVVVGWDDRSLFSQRIRNYSAKPIDLEIRRSFAGHAIVKGRLGAKNHDYRTIQFSATVAPRAKVDLRYELTVHQGTNAKQENVTIEEADPR